MPPGIATSTLRCALDRARAATGFAGGGQVLTRAPTAGAGAREHDEAALRRDLAGAPALAAGLGLGARLGAGAVAGVTGGRAADVDLVLAAEQRVAQGNRRFDSHVLAAFGALATAATALRLTAKAPEEIGEHVLEVTQDVAHRHRSPERRSARRGRSDRRPDAFRRRTSTVYASLASLNFSSAALSPGFRSG